MCRSKYYELGRFLRNLVSGANPVSRADTSSLARGVWLNGELFKWRGASTTYAATPQSRQIATRTSGVDVTADRTLSVSADSVTERIDIQNGGTLVGTRKALNIIQGANTTITVADDSAGNKVNITLKGCEEL